MRNGGTDEEHGEREPHGAVAAGCESQAAHSGSDDPAELERGGSHARDPQTELGREAEATRASGERAASGDAAWAALKTRWKRDKHWITSPDPEYALKKTSATG